MDKWNSVELSFKSSKLYDNPYIDVEIYVDFTSPTGEVKKVLGFWDGEDNWKVRFSPMHTGQWKWTSYSNDLANDGFNNITGTIDVNQYCGDNAIYKHGFIKVNENKRGFCHEDETPFFWLGDTIWTMASKVTTDEWEEYLKARKLQDFNVVLVNALVQHDGCTSNCRIPFMINVDGYDFSRPNIEYFKYLDKLMAMTTDAGILVALVMLWFDYVPGANPTWNIKRSSTFTPELAYAYSRYLTSRYASYGTVWIVSGDSDFESLEAIEVYDAAAKAVIDTTPYSHLITAHLNGGIYTPEKLNEKGWLDFHSYQSSHIKNGIMKSLEYAEKTREYLPKRPVLNSEPSYEQIAYYMTEERITREIVRQVSWISIIGGANAGITYGAHGLWSWQREKEDFRDTKAWLMPAPWKEALNFQGAKDVAVIKEFMQEFDWWELEPLKDFPGIYNTDDLFLSSMNDSRLILGYLIEAKDIKIDTKVLKRYKIKWFNPISKEYETAKLETLGEKSTIKKCSWNNDAVIIFD